MEQAVYTFPSQENAVFGYDLLSGRQVPLCCTAPLDLQYPLKYHHSCPIQLSMPIVNLKEKSTNCA